MLQRQPFSWGPQMMIATVRHLAGAGLVTLLLAGCSSVERVRQMVYSPCHDTDVTLYFDTGSDALTADGKQIVEITAKRLRPCMVRDLKLVGLADPAGAPGVNVELSQRRANNVLDAFVRAGLQVPKYTLVASGQKGAISPQGVVEPVHRRVDVTLVVK
jgi:outer membrane protein OmpA-like peptidoglycan-associated protein